MVLQEIDRSIPVLDRPVGNPLCVTFGYYFESDVFSSETQADLMAFLQSLAGTEREGQPDLFALVVICLTWRSTGNGRDRFHDLCEWARQFNNLIILEDLKSVRWKDVMTWLSKAERTLPGLTGCSHKARKALGNDQELWTMEEVMTRVGPLVDAAVAQNRVYRS